jgi:hypothetical protein
MRKQRMCRTAVAAGLLAMMAGGAANAATLQAAYLFYDWSSPANASSAPFTFNGGTTGYQLTLNGSGVATAVNPLAQPVVVGVQTALTFSNKTGTIDFGESQTTPYRNSQVGIWDDAGIFNSGPPDAALNMDFGSGARVWFNIPDGYTGLIIAEDAGLDPFRLALTDTNTDTGGTIVFNGFTAALALALINTPQFSGEDTSNPGDMDQVFLFLFDGPLTGFARIDEIGNYGGERLEVDYIGVVPLPPAVWLFGSALVGLATLARRRSGKVMTA